MFNTPGFFADIVQTDGKALSIGAEPLCFALSVSRHRLCTVSQNFAKWSGIAS
jgi:hypothetical protein